MYGRKISIIEARRDAGLFQVAQVLGMSDLTDALALSQGDRNQRVTAFIVNLTLLRHEADRLGIGRPNRRLLTR